MLDEIVVICSLQASNDCEGFVSWETAWRDSFGQPWDFCKACAEHQKRHLDSYK